MYDVVSEITQYPFHTILLVTVKPEDFNSDGMFRSHYRMACEMDFSNITKYVVVIFGKSITQVNENQTSMYIAVICISGSYKLKCYCIHFQMQNLSDHRVVIAVQSLSCV